MALIQINISENTGTIAFDIRGPSLLCLQSRSGRLNGRR
jgi:hypothetical protein